MLSLCALAMSAALLAGCGGAGDGQSDSGDQQLVRVPQDSPTIAGAVDRVAPGGLILVSPGAYREQVNVSTENVTLRGTDRNTVVIDGEGVRPYGVVAAADGVRIENLTTTRATLYGVLVTSSMDGDEPLAQGSGGYETIDPDQFPPLQRFSISHVTATNNGLYGIYAFNSQHGVIADSFASGSADSGIYVGQCRSCDIVVTGNVAARNAVGFENANASDSVTITGNRFSDNRVGMTLTSDYQEAFTPQRANAVFGNVIADNHEKRSPRHAEGAFGIGIGIAGGRENVIAANRIAGNPLAGVLFTNAEDLPAIDNVLRGNLLGDNGVAVANVSADRAAASGNCVTGDATELPRGFAAACEADAQPAATSQSLPGVNEPEGLSFLHVPLPNDLPSLPVDDTIPDLLPGTVTHPDPAKAKVPAADLLAAWLTTRA